MFQLDYGDHRPLYEQIKEKTKELIVKGVLSENDKIPSVRELASRLAINPNTIQKAYKDLETEGFIYSLRAKGSFVASQKEAIEHIDTDKLYENLSSIVKKLSFCGESEEKIISHIHKFYNN